VWIKRNIRIVIRSSLIIGWNVLVETLASVKKKERKDNVFGMFVK